MYPIADQYLDLDRIETWVADLVVFSSENKKIKMKLSFKLSGISEQKDPGYWFRKQHISYFPARKI